MREAQTTSIIDHAALEERINLVIDTYRKSAPQVSRWAEELYVRLCSAYGVDLSEIYMVDNLVGTFNDGQKENPNQAQNMVYKLMDRLGRDTTGWSDF